MQIANEGTIAIGTPGTLGIQAVSPGFPLLVAVDTGIAKGGRPSAFPGSLLGFSGFGNVYASPTIAVLSPPTNNAGRALISPMVPNDPNLKGTNLQLQAVSLGLTGTFLSNPAIVEFR